MVELRRDFSRQVENTHKLNKSTELKKNQNACVKSNLLSAKNLYDSFSFAFFGYGHEVIKITLTAVLK